MALKSSKVYKVYVKLFVQSRFFFWEVFERNPPSVIQNYGEVSLIDDWSGFRGGSSVLIVGRSLFELFNIILYF